MKIIEVNCDNCRLCRSYPMCDSDCEDNSKFVPREDMVELQQLIAEYDVKLRKALTAIEEHRSVTMYANGFRAPKPVDVKLWEELG
jgi:hypothetical protein